MIKNKKIRKVITTGALILMLSTLVGCGSKHTPVKPDKDPNKVVQDKNMTDDLKKEKEILTGQVYVQDNMAIGTMVIKEGVSEERAKVLAEEYAKEIKKTYKDMTINVQAVQNGKNVANIILEK